MSVAKDICQFCIHEHEMETYCKPTAYNHYCPEFQFFEPKCCGNCEAWGKELVDENTNKCPCGQQSGVLDFVYKGKEEYCSDWIPKE